MPRKAESRVNIGFDSGTVFSTLTYWEIFRIFLAIFHKRLTPAVWKTRNFAAFWPKINPKYYMPFFAGRRSLF